MNRIEEVDKICARAIVKKNYEYIGNRFLRITDLKERNEKKRDLQQY